MPEVMTVQPAIECSECSAPLVVSATRGTPDMPSYESADGSECPSGVGHMPQAMTVERECTPEESQLWRDRYSDGYQAGRGDVKWNSVRGDLIVDIPPEVPGECGARYVARHVGIAWEIGYTSAVLRGAR
jgi:hypothetical protein